MFLSQWEVHKVGLHSPRDQSLNLPSSIVGLGREEQHSDRLKSVNIPSRARILGKKPSSFPFNFASASESTRKGAYMEPTFEDPSWKLEPKIFSAFPLTSNELS